MERLGHGLSRIMAQRGTYETVAVNLSLALIVSGKLPSAAAVSLNLVWFRDRVIEEAA
jgi:hypothetical protein